MMYPKPYSIYLRGAIKKKLSMTFSTLGSKVLWYKKAMKDFEGIGLRVQGSINSRVRRGHLPRASRE